MEGGNKSKYASFFKDKYNLILIGILIFAVIIRWKYAFINTGLWFDEAEYLAIAKMWVSNIPWHFHPVRPPLLPMIAAAVFWIGGGETILHFLVFLVSVGGVFAVYLIGKELYNKPVGLIGAFVMSIFYLHIFFTSRILTDVPSTTIYTVAAYLFLKGYSNKKYKRYLWWLGFITALGVLLRFPTGYIVATVLIYLILTTGFKFLKNKNIWIGFGIMIATLLPYFIWFNQKFGGIAIISSGGEYSKGFFIPGYIKLFSTYFYSPLFGMQGYFMNILLLCFFAGLGLILFDILLGYDLLKKDKLMKSHVFTFLFFLTPFFYFGFSGDHIEPRYIMHIFPGAFIIIGYALFKGSEFLSKYQKYLGVALVVVILAMGGYYQVKYANELTTNSASSFSEMKPAGEWIKANSFPEDKIIADGAPMFAYYSERKVLPYAAEDDFLERVKRDKPKYMILYAVERSPEWAYDWPPNNQDKLTPVHVIPNNQQPLLIIYKFNEEIFEE